MHAPRGNNDVAPTSAELAEGGIELWVNGVLIAAVEALISSARGRSKALLGSSASWPAKARGWSAASWCYPEAPLPFTGFHRETASRRASALGPL